MTGLLKDDLSLLFWTTVTDDNSSSYLVGTHWNRIPIKRTILFRLPKDAKRENRLIHWEIDHPERTLLV